MSHMGHCRSTTAGTPNGQHASLPEGKTPLVICQEPFFAEQAKVLPFLPRFAKLAFCLQIQSAGSVPESSVGSVPQLPRPWEMGGWGGNEGRKAASTGREGDNPEIAQDHTLHNPERCQLLTLLMPEGSQESGGDKSKAIIKFLRKSLRTHLTY